MRFRRNRRQQCDFGEISGGRQPAAMPVGPSMPLTDASQKNGRPRGVGPHESQGPDLNRQPFTFLGHELELRTLCTLSYLGGLVADLGGLVAEIRMVMLALAPLRFGKRISTSPRTLGVGAKHQTFINHFLFKQLFFFCRFLAPQLVVVLPVVLATQSSSFHGLVAVGQDAFSFSQAFFDCLLSGSFHPTPHQDSPLTSPVSSCKWALFTSQRRKECQRKLPS